MNIAKQLLALAVCGSVLFGAGCFGGSQKTPAPKSPETSAANPVAKRDEKPKDPKTELMEVLSAFHDTKSYRTKFKLPTKDGVVKGTLDHNKPDRFQGTTQLNNSEISQMVIVGKSLYMKLGNNPWSDLSETKGGKQITENMKNAAQGNTAFSQEHVDKLQVISRYNDELNGCILYIARPSDAKPESPPIKICAKGGYPKYFELETDMGVYHVDFYDFNAVFLIERPM